MMNNNKRKRKRPNSEGGMSVEELSKLEDLVHHYGGEEMILRTKDDTPVNVLQAFHKLNRFHGDSVQFTMANVSGEKEKAIEQINLFCFQFIQTSFISHPQWIPRTRELIGGKLVLCKGVSVMTSIPPPRIASTSVYHT